MCHHKQNVINPDKYVKQVVTIKPFYEQKLVDPKIHIQGLKDSIFS